MAAKAGDRSLVKTINIIGPISLPLNRSAKSEHYTGDFRAKAKQPLNLNQGLRFKGCLCVTLELSALMSRFDDRGGRVVGAVLARRDTVSRRRRARLLLAGGRSLHEKATVSVSFQLGVST